MSKISKKNYTTFVKLLTDALSEYTKDVNTFLGYTTIKVNTMYGILTITLRIETNTELYSLCSIFEDVEKAKVLLNVNPNSGKYNFRYGNEYTPTEVVKQMMEILTPLFKTHEM